MTRASTQEYYACQSSASFVFLWALTNSGGRKERSLSVGKWIHSVCTRTGSRQRIWHGSEKDLPVSSIREKDRQVPVEEIHDDPVVALMKELGTPMARENYLELAYLKKNPVLSAEEEAELPEQFKLRDPEEDVLDLPIGPGGDEVDVIITCEKDAIRCLHEVYWPGCTACEFNGPKGVQ